MVCIDGIALFPIKKVSRYFFVSNKYIKIRIDQCSFYGFSFMFATSNCYDIAIFLLRYLSKIINLDCNEFIFNFLALISVFTYWNVVTFSNIFFFVYIDSYLFLNSI